MSATAQDLKDFFALTDNPDVEPVTDDQLLAVEAWLEDHTGIENPGPDDLIDYLYTTLKQQVISHKRATSAHSF